MCRGSHLHAIPAVSTNPDLGKQRVVSVRTGVLRLAQRNRYKDQGAVGVNQVDLAGISAMNGQVRFQIKIHHFGLIEVEQQVPDPKPERTAQLSALGNQGLAALNRLDGEQTTARLPN